MHIYLKIPGKIYQQKHNEIITGVFLERFTTTTVRGKRVMHKILKCSPVIMKNHVLNWCQWWVKLSLVIYRSCSCFSGDRPVEELKPNLPNLKGFSSCTITSRYVLILRDRPLKKVNGGEPKKNPYKNNSRENMHTTGTTGTTKELCLGCSSWDESSEPRWKSFRTVKCVLLILGY